MFTVCVIEDQAKFCMSMKTQLLFATMKQTNFHLFLKETVC